jgi:hypothetical protein
MHLSIGMADGLHAGQCWTDSEAHGRHLDRGKRSDYFECSGYQWKWVCTAQSDWR